VIKTRDREKEGEEEEALGKKWKKWEGAEKGDLIYTKLGCV
jgi:hypothetical protein